MMSLALISLIEMHCQVGDIKWSLSPNLVWLHLGYIFGMHGMILTKRWNVPVNTRGYSKQVSFAVWTTSLHRWTVMRPEAPRSRCWQIVRVWQEKSCVTLNMKQNNHLNALPLQVIINTYDKYVCLFMQLTSWRISTHITFNCFLVIITKTDSIELRWNSTFWK